jgi:hypothetical protein
MEIKYNENGSITSERPKIYKFVYKSKNDTIVIDGYAPDLSTLIKRLKFCIKILSIR